MCHFQRESFKRICEKEVKVMIKEVKALKGYLKNNCKSRNSDKVNVTFLIHVR
jgi:hypothetical protein